VLRAATFDESGKGEPAQVITRGTMSVRAPDPFDQQEVPGFWRCWR
jgi:hypothetical protein